MVTTRIAPESDPAKDGAPRTNDDKVGTSASDFFRRLSTRLAEIGEYASYFISAKSDALKLSLRTAILYAALGVVGLIVALSAIATAVVLFLVGAADAIGAALRGRAWAGDLVIGGFIILAIVIAIPLVLKKVTNSSRTKTVEKYESRKHTQDARFGHDVADRARQNDG